MSLLNSHITNLPQYVNIFQTCVLHLINYQSIHIPPLQFPLILSRHELIRPRSGSYKDPKFYFLQINGPQPFTYNTSLNRSQVERETTLRPYKLIIIAQQRKWNCLTRFYIFPPKYWPQTDITEEDFTLVGDEDATYSYGLNCFPRLGFHILILKPLLRKEAQERIIIWNNKLNRLLKKNQRLEILVAKTDLSPPQLACDSITSHQNYTILIISLLREFI
ncbi:hypothetical protein Fcan01_23162 [Folsomia candida]|uniref:Uncharacterized protein n=1 Tax=Folsomia candida TaxID=158441 RepID=A0A226DAI3_FOLCA|nr:hypothetical protein Fcan01_23162 [Folsomia candida]